MLVAQVRHHRLEIGDERHVGARARDVGQVERRRETSASSQSGPRARTSPFGPATHRRAGKLLAALAADEIVSATYTPCSSAMSRMSRSQRLTLAGPGTPSDLGHAPRAGGAAAHEDELRAVERGDRPGHASARHPRTRASRRVPTACRTRGPRARVRRNAPRRTGRRWAETPCDARAGRAGSPRRGSRTWRCCTACCSRSRRSPTHTSTSARSRRRVGAVRSRGELCRP